MRFLVILLALPLLAPTCQEAPAPPTTAQSQAERGAEIFRGYCGSCHGVTAQGDGPVAPTLKTPPADLTRIAERRDGVFEAPAVAAFIDGRERLDVHGASDMPVWGRRFDDRVSGGLADETRLAPGSIYLIVEYLRSIQR